MRYLMILMTAILARPAFASLFVCSFYAADDGKKVTVIANFSEPKQGYSRLVYLGQYQTLRGAYPAYCHSGDAGDLVCEPVLADQPMAYFLRDSDSGWKIVAKDDPAAIAHVCEVVR